MAYLPPSRIVLPAGAWPSVLDFLCERFAAVSRDAWLGRLERGLVEMDGEPIGPGAAFVPGAVVTYRREVADEPPIPFEETLVHVDDDLVVADKPHFLPVMPTGRFVEQTLSVRLIRRLENDQLAALHRLDRLTAGLVVFSAQPSTRDAYTRLFRERCIRKVYEAVAPPLRGQAFPFVYESRIERGEPFFRMREAAGEPNAQTRIDVIERGERYWRYRLEPVTGRKHQLRVHMAALGVPILGDPWYPALREETGGFGDPLRLLARELRFEDPIDGTGRVFISGRSLDL